MGDKQIEQYKTEISFCREGFLQSALGLFFHFEEYIKIIKL